MIRLNDVFFDAKDVIQNNFPFVEQHVHTDFTDGSASPRALIQRAMELGCRRIIFTEHVQRRSYWFQEFRDIIKRLQKEFDDRIDIGLGIEAKLLDSEGRIDCRPEFMEEATIIMGSVHGFPRGFDCFAEFEEMGHEEALQDELDCALSLIRCNNGINVLGHPMGMVLQHFPIEVAEYYFDRIAEELSAHSIAFDVNAKYHSQYLPVILSCCERHNAMINLGSDVHALTQVGHIHQLLLARDCAH